MKRSGRGAPGAVEPKPGGEPAGLLARLHPLAIGLPLLVLARAVMWSLLPNAAEDAYITFRYARQLILGHGLVYNPGERVFGFTSPLWTLWCALGDALLHDPLGWARGSAIALDGVTLFCTVSLLERRVSRAAALGFAVFFAAWPYFSALAVSGMEMDALLALAALSAWLAERESRWTGLALGALALTRPEAVAAAALLSLGAKGRDRAIALGIAVIGFGALALYYGSPIPHSLMAKARLYGTVGPWEGRLWWDWLFPADLGRIPVLAEPLHLWPLKVVLAPAVAAGAWALRRDRLALLAGAGVVAWAGYALLGVAYFFWYFALPAFAVALLAAVGLPRIVRGAWIPAAMALFIAGAWTLYPIRTYQARARVEMNLFGQMANDLKRYAKSGDKLLLEPLGMVGWVNMDLRIADEAGLVAPDVVRRRAQGPGWYADELARFDPDWIVVRYGFLTDAQAFAGAGAAFRSPQEAQAAIGRYQIVSVTAQKPDASDLALMHRR